LKYQQNVKQALARGLVVSVSYLPVTEDIGAMGREIKSHHGLKIQNTK
jgi:hypothetical protein